MSWQKQFLNDLGSAESALHAVTCPGVSRLDMLAKALTCLRSARGTCRKQAAHKFIDNSFFHVSQLHGQPGPNGYHHTLAIKNIDLARSAALDRHGQAVPLSVSLAAIDVIETLPADDESPARAQAFISKVTRSCHSAVLTDTLREVYGIAADGDWGWTLADINMLVFSLEMNTVLASTVIEDGSVTKILARLSRDTAQSYWDWLWGKVS